MRAHPEIVRALARERIAEETRATERERAAACAVARERAAVAVGDSLRLRDGRWVHLRHDSA